MRKIVIFGNSGSGKSTLAKNIAQVHTISHLDLDNLAWLAVSPPRRAPIGESKTKIDQFISDNDNWVVEGCYADLLELIIPSSTEIVFLNLDVEQCVENAKRRPWEPHKYASKDEQDKNLEMLIGWIRQYRDREDEFSYQAHLSLFENYAGKKTMCVRNDEYTSLSQ